MTAKRRSPQEGPRETRRTAGVGRTGRTTGCRAGACQPERLSMSDPHGLPTRASLPQPQETSPMSFTVGRRLGREPAMPSACSTGRPRSSRASTALMTAAGLADLLARLKRVAAPAALPVALERPVRPLGRDPGGRRSPGRADPPQRGQSLPSALPRRRRQVRSGRRLHAGRYPAHRRPPLRAASAGLGRDQGAARAGPRPRPPGRCPRAGSPTSCAACSKASGPAPAPSSPPSTARSRSPS